MVQIESKDDKNSSKMTLKYRKVIKNNSKFDFRQTQTVHCASKIIWELWRAINGIFNLILCPILVQNSSLQNRLICLCN